MKSMKELKDQAEEKVWELFDKHNMATHEDEGGVPCADEIAQYCVGQIKKVINEVFEEIEEYGDFDGNNCFEIGGEDYFDIKKKYKWSK